MSAVSVKPQPVKESVLTARVKTMAQWLALFIQPDQVSELRAIMSPDDPREKVVSRCFDGKHLLDMADCALALESQESRGVYFTPNPLRLAAGGRKAATDADVIERHWLLVDVDPIRPAASSATDAERMAAWTVLDRCRGTMDAGGFHDPLVCDSGNGWHLCYPVRMPNDDQVKQFVRAMLQGLQQRCGDQSARVDVSTFNASRIWKLPGTLARKGSPTEERPHRYSRVIE